MKLLAVKLNGMLLIEHLRVSVLMCEMNSIIKIVMTGQRRTDSGQRK